MFKIRLSNISCLFIGVGQQIKLGTRWRWGGWLPPWTRTLGPSSLCPASETGGGRQIKLGTRWAGCRGITPFMDSNSGGPAVCQHKSGEGCHVAGGSHGRVQLGMNIVLFSFKPPVVNQQPVIITFEIYIIEFPRSMKQSVLFPWAVVEMFQCY